MLGISFYRACAGNGIETRWQRSADPLAFGALARLVHRRAPPARTAPASEPVAQTTQDLITALLGVRSAQAQPAVPSAPTQAAQPGLLDQPADPQALLDTRYLWSAAGPLLLTQGARLGQRAQDAHVYDARGQLIASVRSQADAAGATWRETVWRYAYDHAQHRLLAQQGVTGQDELGRTEAAPTDAQRAFDADGNPAQWPGASTAAMPLRWDALGRLQQVGPDSQSLARYGYDHRGLRITKATPAQVSHTLYDAQRRPQAELDAQGRIRRLYVWLGRQPLAVIDPHEGAARVPAEPTALQSLAQAGRDAVLLVRLWAARLSGSEVSERSAWLHVNHLGAPELATDANAQPLWQARYAPFGEASIQAGAGFTLNLRLPGQVFDAETGWHYNQACYYDPRAGQYLSPDPLGHPDGPNPYAYAANDPLRFIDPDGRTLFAFDGTGNSTERDDPAMEGNGMSNVVLFQDLYKDGHSRYVTGVGTVHKDPKYGDIVPDTYAKNSRLDWITPNTPLFYNDMGGNFSGPARIDRMELYMRDEAMDFKDDQMMDIDIIGFSRGAAEARDFSNRIVAASVRQGGKTYYRYENPDTHRMNCQWINFRFMGLWDSVLSTNYTKTTYNLGIPAPFSHVAHAVALNEYRSDSFSNWSSRNPKPYNQHMGGFPLQSIGASTNEAGRVRIERGFLGAHADIGGGYAEGENQLAQVALNWMVAQAQAAGIKLDTTRLDPLPTGNPVLHDQSNAMILGDPRTAGKLGARPPYTTVRAEDREVRGAPSGSTQRGMGFGNTAGGTRSMTNADTHQFITYRPRDVNQLGTGSAQDPATLRNITGTVDMQAYLAWLRKNGYTFAGAN